MEDAGGDNFAAAGGVLPPRHYVGVCLLIPRALVPDGPLLAVIEKDDGGALHRRSLLVEVAGGVRLAAPGGDLFPRIFRFIDTPPALALALAHSLRLPPHILQPHSTMEDAGGDNLAAAGGSPPRCYIGLLQRAPLIDDTLLEVIEDDGGALDRRSLAAPGGDLLLPDLRFTPAGHGAFSTHLMEAERVDVGEGEILRLLTSESEPVLLGSGYAALDGESGDLFVLLDGALVTEPENADYWLLFALGGSPPVTAGSSPGETHDIAVVQRRRFSVARSFNLAAVLLLVSIIGLLMGGAVGDSDMCDPELSKLHLCTDNLDMTHLAPTKSCCNVLTALWIKFSGTPCICKSTLSRKLLHTLYGWCDIPIDPFHIMCKAAESNKSHGSDSFWSGLKHYKEIVTALVATGVMIAMCWKVCRKIQKIVEEIVTALVATGVMIAMC